MTCLAAQELLKQFHTSSQVFQAVTHFLTAATIHIQIQDTNIMGNSYRKIYPHFIKTTKIPSSKITAGLKDSAFEKTAFVYTTYYFLQRIYNKKWGQRG